MASWLKISSKCPQCKIKTVIPDHMGCLVCCYQPLLTIYELKMGVRHRRTGWNNDAGVICHYGKIRKHRSNAYHKWAFRGTASPSNENYVIWLQLQADAETYKAELSELKFSIDPSKVKFPENCKLCRRCREG